MPVPWIPRPTVSSSQSGMACIWRVRGRALALGGLRSVPRPQLRAGGAVAVVAVSTHLSSPACRVVAACESCYSLCRGARGPAGRVSPGRVGWISLAVVALLFLFSRCFMGCWSLEFGRVR